MRGPVGACAFLLLIPLVSYTIGPVGMFVLYVCAMAGVALLYAAQKFATRGCLPRLDDPLLRRRRPYAAEGRHVLITGGSMGIGLALALEAVQRGAAVVTLVARGMENLMKAKDHCIQKATECGAAVTIQIVQQDIENDDEIPKCLETAAALKIHHVLPSMIERGHGVVCVSNSLAALVPIYGYTAYAATKAALKAFSVALDQEVAGAGILISNAYMPSVETPGYENEQRVRHKITDILEGTVRAKKPEDVAQMIFDGLENGNRTITFDFEGWALARLCAGFSRAESFASLIYESLLGGILRVALVGLFLQFYQVICKDKAAQRLAAKKA